MKLTAFLSTLLLVAVGVEAATPEPNRGCRSACGEVQDVCQRREDRGRDRDRDHDRGHRGGRGRGRDHERDRDGRRECQQEFDRCVRDCRD